jgi:ABC-2 type transport system permease protein
MSNATLVRPVPRDREPAVAGPTARPSAPVRDTMTMVGRGLRLSRRNVEALITSLMLPVMLMLVFVYLFGGAIKVDVDYATYIVPGVILLCASFGSAMTAVTVSQDMHSGIVDRFRSMDISGASVIAGHVVASVARNLVSSTLVFGVGLAIGFRPHASVGQWFGVIGVLVLVMVAISWLAAVGGLWASSPETANGLTFIFMFVPYASSAFVPIATMPSWLHGFARNQPTTPIIESIRSLLAGAPNGNDIAAAALWCAGILAISVVGSIVMFRKRTR